MPTIYSIKRGTGNSRASGDFLSSGKEVRGRAQPQLSKGDPLLWHCREAKGLDLGGHRTKRPSRGPV